MHKKANLVGAISLGLVLTAQVEAVESIAIEGGFTAVAQVSDDKNIDEELTTSFDLVTTLPTGAGEWMIYVEGNTSPRADGVSNQLGEANADAGSALDRDGEGRFQVSELNYSQPYGGGLLVSGLMDVMASFDGSDIASDETSQFLSGPLTGNPTIGAPDYTLGVTYSRETGEDQGYSFVLSSSHGLADNPNASYSQLMDVGEDGKGIFAAAEGQWPVAGTKMHAGVWINTADYDLLDGGSATEENYGVYLVVDGQIGASLWNLRAGLANDEVSQASQFLSLAMEQPIDKMTLGLGVAYTGLSDQDATPEQDDMLQAEGYLRFTLRNDVSVTPSVQWLSNSGFDASDASVDSEQILLSLRVNYTF